MIQYVKKKKKKGLLRVRSRRADIRSLLWANHKALPEMFTVRSAAFNVLDRPF